MLQMDRINCYQYCYRYEDEMIYVVPYLKAIHQSYWSSKIINQFVSYL